MKMLKQMQRATALSIYKLNCDNSAFFQMLPVELLI